MTKPEVCVIKVSTWTAAFYVCIFFCVRPDESVIAKQDDCAKIIIHDRPNSQTFYFLFCAAELVWQICKNKQMLIDSRKSNLCSAVWALCLAFQQAHFKTHFVSMKLLFMQIYLTYVSLLFLSCRLPTDCNWATLTPSLSSLLSAPSIAYLCACVQYCSRKHESVVCKEIYLTQTY